MKKNTIYTDIEYMAQGFKARKVPMIRRQDELYNTCQQMVQLQKNRKKRCL